MALVKTQHGLISIWRKRAREKSEEWERDYTEGESDDALPGRVRERAPATLFPNLTLSGEPASHQRTLLRHLEPRLNLRVVFVEFARQAAVFQHQAVGVVEVNRLGPAVVDHLRDFDALLLEFLALLIQSGFAARLERKMIEGRRHAEPARDRCIVLGGNPFHAPRFHKSHQLVAPGVEEDVADTPALFDGDQVASHRLEAHHVLIERAGLVHVESRKPEM